MFASPKKFLCVFSLHSMCMHGSWGQEGRDRFVNRQGVVDTVCLFPIHLHLL